jgi:hypothetical protein
VHCKERYAGYGDRQQYHPNNEKRMNLSPASLIALFNWIKEGPSQSFEKRAVAGTPIDNKEARSRLLGDNEFQIRHQRTAVALIG